ncbi:MAG: carbon dioxide concentrating mechanism protein [Kastovskya adunca ATA6-11-RM4]|jgi:carbon dioxide concentrating mechanism protein CcmN|nr:carbon dioxide concentrating mechanism protein [Kastovskya adunca ATA6-11-RM4]
MHALPLPSVSNSDVYVKGDVSIDQSVAIAPGVILQADLDSRIIIAPGVCLGRGTIIHAHNGTVEIESGAVLGASVLVVGQCKIGENACIGAATTIWDTSVEPRQVVPAASLLGDTGRQLADIEPPIQEEATVTNNGHSPEMPPETSPPTPEANLTTAPIPEPPPTPISGAIYGQANLNRLLLTLFPHRKTLNPSLEDEQRP